MHRRTLNELNLIDDFLFSQLLTRSIYAEEFGKIMIKTITGKEVPHLRITVQKPVFAVDTRYHGIRMDVYMDEAESEESSTPGQEIFDIEPDNNDKAEDKKSLPRRLRYYHSMIDKIALESGKKYHHLRNVWIIMIMSYDPLGEDRVIYTIRNMVEEDHDISYDDGAKTVLLYTHGSKGNISEELRQFLLYFEQTTDEHAVNATLLRIHEMVKAVKHSEEVQDEFMKTWEWEDKFREEGREEGLKEGREEGRREERIHTQQERDRADRAEQEIVRLRKELEQLKKKLS